MPELHPPPSSQLESQSSIPSVRHGTKQSFSSTLNNPLNNNKNLPQTHQIATRISSDPSQSQSLLASRLSSDHIYSPPLSDPSCEGGKRRLSSENAQTPRHMELSRRHSETHITQQNRRQSLANKVIY